jgi:hypothetical protein
MDEELVGEMLEVGEEETSGPNQSEVLHKHQGKGLWTAAQAGIEQDQHATCNSRGCASTDGGAMPADRAACVHEAVVIVFQE